MVKRIIILALCFMVYIIINIDTVTAPEVGESSSSAEETANREFEFGLLVKCYKQMYENGLINGIIHEQTYVHPANEFSLVLSNLYRDVCKIQKTMENGNDDLVPDSDYENFKNAVLFENFKNQFLNSFVQSGYDLEFSQKVNELWFKIQNNELSDYPLTEFAKKFAHRREKEYLETPKLFCNEYSVNPDFIDTVTAPHNP